MASNIDFVLEGIGQLLNHRKLAVPIFQRSFAWDDDEVNEFLSDLRTAFVSDPREYFLGTVVLSKDGPDNRDTVIDGQQRLATTTILFSALRDYFRSQGDDDRAGLIHGDYIGKFDDVEGDTVAKLHLNAEDNGYFGDRIVAEGQVPDAVRPSHILINKARQRMDVFVAQLAADAGVGWSKQLVDWRKFIETDIRVGCVTVPSESDAFMIFETLNDRGAELTLADLIKNFLFGLARDKLNTVRENWTTALAQFDMDVNLFVKFFRHHWSSIHGLVRERDLYKNMKLHVNTKALAVKFSADLVKSSQRYAAILNSEHDFWNDWGGSAKQNIETLGILRLEQNRPMLLAVLDSFSKPEAKKVLRASVSWSVRGLIVGGLGGGSFETAYCDAAVKIRSGEITTVAGVLNAVGAVVPGDADFEKRFALANETRARLARYYLLALQDGDAGVVEPELVANANEELVNLEHVLPKNATGADWPAFDAEERRSWPHRLGNMTLLTKAHNKKIGNKPFTQKKPILTASQLSLTKEVGQSATWVQADIDARQVKLAKAALKVWPRK